jgi:hypothetical protein
MDAGDKVAAAVISIALFLPRALLLILASWSLRLAIQEERKDRWRIARNGALTLLALLFVMPASIFRRLSEQGLLILAISSYSLITVVVIGSIGSWIHRRRSRATLTALPPPPDPSPVASGIPVDAS